MAESDRTSIVLQKLANALTCKICNSVTDNPHTVGGCGHFGCHDCLLSLKISKCPMCNEQFYPTDLVPDVVVRTVLQEWRVISNLIDDKSTKRQCEKYGDTETAENKVNKKEKALKTKSINKSSSGGNKLKDSSILNGKEKHKHDDEFKENKLKTHVVKENELKTHVVKENKLKTHVVKENELKTHVVKENELKTHVVKENELKTHMVKENKLKTLVVNNDEDKLTISNEFEINNDKNDIMRKDNDLKNKQLLNEKENKVKMTNNVKDICISPFNALKVDKFESKDDDTRHKNVLTDKQVSKSNSKKDDLKVLKVNIQKISDIKISDINVNKTADLKQLISEKEESAKAVKESGINKTKISDNKKSASNKETIYSKDSTKSATNKESINQLESTEIDKNVLLFSFDYKVTPPVKKYPSKKIFKSSSKKKLVPFNVSTDSDEDFNGFDIGKVNDSLKLTNKFDSSKKVSDNFSNKVKILTDKKKVKNKLSKSNKSTTNNDNFQIKSIIKKDLVTNDDSISSSCEIITATPQENHDHKESKNCRLKKRSVSTESLKSNSSEVSTTSKNSVSKKKDVTKLNKKGETPLQVACTKGNLDAVKALLDEGADPNTKDYAGWTPLHEAVFKGNLSLVNLLLNAGAYINTPGHCNITPLLEAVIKDNVEIARILLQHGADITLRSRYNYLPMQCAESDEMKKLLSVYRMKNTISNNISDGDCNMPDPTALHGTSLNDDQTKILTKFCKQFSITYFDTFRAGVSHVVVNDNGTLVAPPDPSVLRAIVNGIAVISFAWIERCSKENRLLMPDEWEVKGTMDFPNSKAPIKSRYSNKKLLPRLFDGLHIFLWTSNWPKSEKLAKSFVNDLIRDGGAAILSREPDAEAIASDEMTVMFHADISGPMAVCSHVILYVKGPNEPQLKYNMKHIKTLPLTWLLESIQTYSIVNPV